MDSYQTTKDFVIGHVSREKSTDNDDKEPTGYFILDTKSGEVEKGMTKDVFMSSLNKKGIHTDLKLKQPDIALALLSKIEVL